MITEKDLQEAIAECQGIRNPTSTTCMKLAAYYIIRDNMEKKDERPVVKASQKPAPMINYSYATEPVEYSSDSEFSRAITDKDMDHVLSVMDELMSTLNVINPRLYEGVMTKLLY